MTELLELVEVLVPLTEAEAANLDKLIRAAAQTARENFEQVGRLLDEAKRGRLHEILGFKSWTAYVADAVGGRIQLSGDARAAMVQMLAAEGMSIRAMAKATGVSKSTVDRDLAQVSHCGTPETEELHLWDNAASEPEKNPDTAVTGLDGKTYTKRKKEPRPPKADSLNGEAKEAPERRLQVTTAYREGLKDLNPVIERISALTQDRRWDKAIPHFREEDRTAIEEYIAALQRVRLAMIDTSSSADS